ncbi:MAG: 50S ribosomal protein L19e [Methanoregulaceae archaeon]
MSDLTNQRRMAGAILKCGVHRIWFDPERLSDIQNAVSREDVRGLVGEGAIKAHQKIGVSRGRAREKIANRAYGHAKGHGRRKGAAGARTPSKLQWIKKIRAIRKTLVELRETGVVDAHMYRMLYRKAAGGQFRSVAHLKAQMEILAGRMK